MRTLVIIYVCELEEPPEGYYMPDMVQNKTYRLFTDYDKARAWTLEWVKDYNKTLKKTVRGASGEFEELDEPVLIEVEPNHWDCPLAEVAIYQGDKINDLKPEEIIIMPD
jgi:hypothetical protein